jgi:DNA invertase Pin-like site-specific DNA recombinase
MQAQSLAVGYARVSVESEDIGNQVHAIEDYAKTNNLTLVGVFKDVGVSGAKPALEREGFRQSLTALESMTVLFDLL